MNVLGLNKGIQGINLKRFIVSVEILAILLVLNLSQFYHKNMDAPTSAPTGPPRVDGP